SGGGDVGLVAGSTAAGPPTFLPKQLRNLLPPAEARDRDIVRLGRFEAFRYRSVRAFGYQLVLYVTPAADTTTVACFARADRAAALRGCAGIAASLTVAGATPIQLHPDRSYAARLASALARLRTDRSAGLAAMLAAKSR